MSILLFPFLRRLQNKHHAIESIASYQQKKQNQNAELDLGDKFTLTEDLHNPVIQCNACKEDLIFTAHATVKGMRDDMNSHLKKCPGVQPQRICSWHKTYYGNELVMQEGTQPATHSCCEDCNAKVLAEIELMKAEQR